MTTSARYDEIADFYESFAPDSYGDPLDVALLDLVGDVDGQRILDLACGHGKFSRELARRGASVVGLDVSAALLEKALASEASAPLGVVYQLGDASSDTVLLGEVFDAVVCSFALCDIDNLAGALTTVARVLRAGGIFVFSLLHPCFPGWESRQAEPSWAPADGYFHEGWRRTELPASGLRSKVGMNHRMLSTYINELVSCGLAIDLMAEPEPASWFSDLPKIGPVPFYLTARCRKVTA